MTAKEGTVFLVALLAVAGCGKSKPKDDVSGKKEKEDKIPLPSASFGAGFTTVAQSDAADALPSFTLAWKTGNLGVAEGSVKTGRLIEPHGHLFTKGQESSAYRADTGDADHDTKRLNVDGNVTVESKDQKYKLRADHGVYLGDVGLIRAKGKVVADGPFGTLSGLPEVWATADYRLIGTPDMVSQKLKIPALIALAATAATGTARLQGPAYEAENGGPLALKRIEGGAIEVTIKPAGPGPLVIKVPGRGLRVESAGTVVMSFVPKGGDVTHLTTTGKTRVVQTQTTKDGTATVTIDGQNAVYDWNWKAKAETASLNLAGPVTIVKKGKVQNQAKQGVDQTTTAKGSRATAVLLNKPKPDEDGLKSATLIGNVTLDVSEVDGQSFSGSGERLVYTPSGDLNGVEMVGGVKMIRETKDKDGTSRVVAQGARGTAALFAKPKAGDNPLRDALLVGSVVIDVTGSNGDVFKGTGDRLLYEAAGENATATMTGDLKISGDAEQYIGNLSNIDIAVMKIGKAGWERIETSKLDGSPTKTRIDRKPTLPNKKGGQP